MMKHTKRAFRLVSFTLITVFLIGCVPGCSNGGKTASESAASQPTIEATGNPVQTPTPTETEGAGVININFEPDYDVTGNPYTPVEVTPRVADYTINPDLSNIVNLDQFPNLTAEERE